jgi:ABC-type glutathione transport system ATPase component
MEPTQPAPATSNISVRRGEPLVVVDHVEKHFGELHVLNDINTVVNRGEVVVVIGPSGSGKSTLCRAINRLETSSCRRRAPRSRSCAPTSAWCSSRSTCSPTRPCSRT